MNKRLVHAQKSCPLCQRYAADLHRAVSNVVTAARQITERKSFRANERALADLESYVVDVRVILERTTEDA